MKAIVKTQSNYRNLNGKTIHVHEICGSLVACWVYAWEFHAYILADFTKKEVTFLPDEKRIGETIYVNRNQGEREGTIVAVSGTNYVIEYEMPNGSTALNLINDLNNPDDYKSISYKQAFAKGIVQSGNLINNGQKH